MATRLFGSSERARKEQESEEQRLELESSSVRDDVVPRSTLSPWTKQEVLTEPLVDDSGAHFQTSTAPEEPESSTTQRAGKRSSDWSEHPPSKFARKLDATLAPSPVLSPDMTDFSLSCAEVRGMMAGVPSMALFENDDFMNLPRLLSPNPAPLPTSRIASVESLALAEAERRTSEARATTELGHTVEEVPDAHGIPQAQSVYRSPAEQEDREDSGVEEELKAIVAKPKQKHTTAKKERRPDGIGQIKGEKKEGSARKNQAKAKPAKPVDANDNNDSNDINDNATLTAEAEVVAVEECAKQVVSPSEEQTEAKATEQVKKKVASPLKEKPEATVVEQSRDQFSTPPAKRPQSRLTRSQGNSDTTVGIARFADGNGPRLRGGEQQLLMLQSPSGIEEMVFGRSLHEGKVCYYPVQPQNEVMNTRSAFSQGQPNHPGTFAPLPSASVMPQHMPTPMPNNFQPGDPNSGPHGQYHQQTLNPMPGPMLQGPPQVGPHGPHHQQMPNPMLDNLYLGPPQSDPRNPPGDSGHFVSRPPDGPPYANPLGTVPPHWPIYGPPAGFPPMAHGLEAVERAMVPLGQPLPPDAAGPRYVPWAQEGPPELHAMQGPLHAPHFDPWQAGTPNISNNAYAGQHQGNLHIGNNQQWFPPMPGGWH